MRPDGGKGDKPRPFNISQDEYANRWDSIFKRDKHNDDNTGTSKNEYQDILSTEDSLTDPKAE